MSGAPGVSPVQAEHGGWQELRCALMTNCCKEQEHPGDRRHLNHISSARCCRDKAASPWAVGESLQIQSFLENSDTRCASIQQPSRQGLYARSPCRVTL